MVEGRRSLMRQQVETVAVGLGDVNNGLGGLLWWWRRQEVKKEVEAAVCLG